MKTRAKFKVHNINRQDWGTEIHMSPVYGNSEENKSFFAATPSGNIQLTVKNETAAEVFEVNAEYYVDFEKA